MNTRIGFSVLLSMLLMSSVVFAAPTIEDDCRWEPSSPGAPPCQSPWVCAEWVCEGEVMDVGCCIPPSYLWMPNYGSPDCGPGGSGDPATSGGDAGNTEAEKPTDKDSPVEK